MLSMVSKTPSAGNTSMMSGFSIRKYIFLLAVFLFASVANAATFTISTPTANGTFTLTWSGARTYVELYEKVNGTMQKIGDKYNISGSLDITKPPGTYTFVLGDILVYGNQSGGPYTTGTTIEKSVTVAALTAPPSIPASITVIPDDFSDSIAVSWPSTTGAIRYELERNGVDVYSGSATATTPPNSLPNTSYTFRVSACNSYGCSGWRTASAVTLQETFGVPATSNTGQFNINIKTPSHATHTRIEESSSASGPWNTIATLQGNQSHPLTRNNGTYYYRLLYCVFGTQTSTCSLRNQVKSIVVSQPAPSVSASFSPATISEGGSATLNWSSSNATSCSASGIAGVSSASGSTTYTAPSAMNANTTVNITITCSGGGGNNQAATSLSVNWLNDAPTISGIASRTINEDASTGAIGFSVGDEETPASNLVVTATSSNTALIPNGNLVLGGSGANRTISVTPAANAFGSATVTVRVTDAHSGQSQQTFTVTVNSVDDAPVISAIGNLSVNELAETNINFTVTDTDTAISGVTVASSSTTLVTPTLSGSGNNYSVNLKAGRFTTSGTSGQVTLTVQIPFGSTTVTRTFTVTVNNMDPQLWIEETGTVGVYDLKWDYAASAAKIYENGADITNTISSQGYAGPIGTKRITKTSNGTFNYYIQDCVGVTLQGLTCSGTYSQKQIIVTFPKPVVTATFDKTAVNESNAGATNNTATLTWNATNANSCSATGISGVSGTSGSTTFTAPSTLVANGTHTVTVTCIGNGGSTPANAQINLTAINDSPVISAIASPVAINEDASTGAIVFTVSDEETTATNLVVTATSNNQALVPNANIQLGGSGGSRTITATPLANQPGSAVITVTVKDANNVQATRQFTVNVSAVDDAPVISAISNVNIDELAETSVNFTVTDIDSPVSGVSVTSNSSTLVVPTLNGSGNNYSINLTAGRFTSSGTSSPVTITVQVPFGSTTVSRSFTTTVINLEPQLWIEETGTIGVYDLKWNFATSAAKIYENGADITNTISSQGYAGPTGTKRITKTSNGTFTYYIMDCVGVTLQGLTCSGTYSQQQITVTFPKPVVTASFDKTAINESNAGATNTTATLTWSATNANSCSATGISGVSGTSGSTTYTAPSTLVSNGTHTVTVTCIGNGGSTPVNAQINLTALNDLPTISAIVSPVSISEDTATGAVAFTVNDEETAATSLVVTATSSNQVLIPNANIQLGGSAGSRTVTATPLANQSGLAVITVVVKDANNAQATRPYTVSVSAIDDAPVISAVSNISVNEMAETNINFTVTDIDSTVSGVSVSSSSPTLVTPTLSGSGNNYSINIKAARLGTTTGAGQATITIEVPTEEGSSSRTFTVTVNNVSPTLSIEETGTIGVYDLKWDFATSAAKIYENGADITNTISSQGYAGPTGTKRITKTSNGTFTYYIMDCVGVTLQGLTCSGTYSQQQITVTFPKPVVTASFDKTAVNESNAGATNTTATLTWSATNANSCSATGISGVSGTSGSTTYTAPSSLSTNSTHTVTVTCIGNGGTTPTNVQLSLTALNDLPAISAIVSPVAINEDAATGAIAFTISDEETSVANMEVTAVSNNQPLVPNSNIQLGGSGGNRTVTVTPVANQSGTAVITITVKDGNNAQAFRQFTVNVAAVDDAPVISDIAGMTINEGATSEQVSFTIADPDTTSGLQVSASSNRDLIPSQNITLSGSGNSRQIRVKANKITSANTAYEFVTITVSVAGGSPLPVTKTFSVRVNNVSGKLTLPEFNSSGSYSVSWDYATHGVRLFENGKLLVGTFEEPGPQSGSKSITKNVNGKYTYVLEDCSLIGSSSTTSWVCNQSDIKSVQVVLPPAPPTVTIEEVNSLGTYNISWTEVPEATKYIFRENGTIVPDNGAPLVRYKQYLLKPSGTYSYTVQACIDSVCGNQSAPQVIVVGAGTSSSSSSNSSSGGIDDGKYVNSPIPTGPMSHVPVGAIAGSFRVDESGAATYQIPIATAAGTAGVAPQISVGYNSQGSNGILGKAWGLQGLSEISRCRKTLVQDAVQLPITWDYDDRFCLNGQRLVVVSGSYGSLGSEYKTEIDSYVIVKSHGGSQNHPDYFTMTAKDGSLTYFGAPGENNSEIVGRDANGNKVANRTLSWNIQKFEDSVGNPIYYRYNNTANYFQLKEILFAYGTNTTDTGYGAKLSFDYEDRDDPMGGFISGYEFKNTQRLMKIESYSGTSLLRRYQFNYNEQEASLLSGVSSRLTSIQECVESGCLPKTTMSWSLQTSSVGIKDGGLHMPDNRKIYGHLLMDIDGNGKQDLVWEEKAPSQTAVNIYARMEQVTSTGSAGAVFVDHIDIHEHEDPDIYPYDYNNDGRQDLLVYASKSGWSLYLATPVHGGSWSLVKSDVELPILNRHISIGDVDSDGLLDIIGTQENILDVNADDPDIINNTLYIYYLKRDPDQPATSNQLYKLSAEPEIFELDFVPTEGTYYLDEKPVSLLDINGDGQTDIVTNLKRNCVIDPCETNTGRVDVFVKKDGAYVPYHTFTPHSGRFKNVQAIDINADGLSDVALLDINSWKYALSTGTGFQLPKSVHNASLYGSYSLKDVGAALGDVNKDGFADIMWADTLNSTVKSIKVKYWLPKENGFSDVNTYASHVPGDQVYYSYSDIDGDGWTDLVGYNYDNTDYWRIIVNGLSAPKTDLIEEIQNGLGNKIKIHYEPLSKSTHYSRLAGVGDGSGNTSCEGGTTIPYTGETSEQICFDKDIYASDADSFYEQINAPFANIPESLVSEDAPPVQELIGSFYIVTKAETSAPYAGQPNHMNGVAYYYHSAKMQAGGRGMLGFEKLRSVDLQTRISTVTTYRQDWPFIGQPINTTTFKDAVVDVDPNSNPASLGALLGALGSATNSPVIRNYDDGMIDTIQTEGTSDLGGIQLHVPTVSQTEYGYNSDGSVVLLASRHTETEIDDWGNVVSILVSTYDAISGNEVKSIQTTNTYGDGSGDYYDRMGRLTRTEVETLDSLGNSSVRTSAFEYCSEDQEDCPHGLLWKEIVEPDDASFQLTTTYTYDAFGNKTNAVQSDVNGDVRYSSTKSYDGNGRYVDKSVNVIGQENAEVIQRNKYGSATEVEDINGVKTVIVYDDLGGEYLRADQSGAWTYSSKAFCSQVSDCPTGAVLLTVKMVSGGGRSFEYQDLLGRVIRTSTIGFNGARINVDVEYNMLGQVSRKSNPYFEGGSPTGWTVNSYDRMQRLTQTQLPDESIGLTMNYQGRRTTITNALGMQKIEQRNALGELTHVWDNTADDATQGISYAYDLYGNLTSVVSPGNVVVKICYDKLGRKIAMHDPDKGGFAGNGEAACPADGKVPSTRLAGWWYYRYNNFGELINQYSPRQQVVSMTYDALRRMTTRLEPEGGTRWYYDNSETVTDSIGKLMYVISSPSGIPGTDPATACSGANHCTQYTYDSLGRQTHTTLYLPNDTHAYVSSVDYDTIGRVYRESDVMGIGSGVRRHFNEFGYEFKTTDLASGDVLHKIESKNERGQITEEWRFNGGAGITTYVYDEVLGHLREQKSGIGNLFGIQHIEYDWDAVGNLKYRNNIKQGNQESFCYDALNRLVKTHNDTIDGSCSPDMADADMEYTPGGNIVEKNGIVYTYDGGTQAGPHAVTSTSDGISYQYDANGNLRSDTSGRSITYSSYDQPLRIAKGSSNAIEFSYNASRARWQRTDIQGSTRTTTTYLGNVERIHQQGSTTIEWKRYIAGAIYTFKTNLDHVVQGGVNKRFTFTDHLGSLDTITDTAGNVTDRLSFDPWGQRRNPTDWAALTSAQLIGFKLPLAGFVQSLTTRGYTGHEMLDSMGLVHMNGRIYDPKLARFMQADPHIDGVTNTQGYNRYSYVWNNPLNATDPSGYWVQFAVAVGAYIVGRVAAKNNIPFLAEFAAIVGCATGFCPAATFGTTYGKTGNLGLAIMATGLAFAGQAAGALGNSAGGIFARAFIGGMSAHIYGGDFNTGFISAGLSAWLVPGPTNGFDGSEFVRNMVVGGTISWATGGKFGNGAFSAAFSYAMAAGAKVGKKEPGYSGEGGLEVPESTSDKVTQSSLTDEKAAKRLKLLSRFEIIGGTDEQRAKLQEALTAYVLTDDGYSNIVLSKEDVISIHVVQNASTSGVPGRISFNFESIGKGNQISIAFGENNYLHKSILRTLAHEMHHAASGYKPYDEVSAMIHENRVVKQNYIRIGLPQLAGERRFYASPYTGYNPPKNANYLY